MSTTICTTKTITVMSQKRTARKSFNATRRRGNGSVVRITRTVKSASANVPKKQELVKSVGLLTVNLERCKRINLTPGEIQPSNISTKPTDSIRLLPLLPSPSPYLVKVEKQIVVGNAIPATIPFTVKSILNHVKIDKRASGDYEPLMLSLQSSFPNEHEFALNACMILSAAEETKELGVIRQCPALLNMLLAHVGFFSKADSSTAGLLCSLIEEASGGMNFASFWEQLCSTEDYELEEVDRHEMLEKLKERFRESSVAYLGRGKCEVKLSEVCNNEKNQIGRRVHWVAHILRNFSFQRENASVMATNPTLLRFLVVTAFSNYGSLPQISIDVISNIAEFFGADGGTGSQCNCKDLHSMLIDVIISNLKYSINRFKILRSMETLICLGRARNYSKNKVIFQDEFLYRRLFELITLEQDSLILVASLELIFTGTKFGKKACNSIEAIHGSVKTLASYVFTRSNGNGDPITKSVCAAAALALRNLVEKSARARRVMKIYEASLIEVASENYDCSGILAQLLFYLRVDENNNLL